MIMVGYDSYSINYRLFNPTIHKVIVSYGVIFIENLSMNSLNVKKNTFRSIGLMQLIIMTFYGRSSRWI